MNSAVSNSNGLSVKRTNEWIVAVFQATWQLDSLNDHVTSSYNEEPLNLGPVARCQVKVFETSKTNVAKNVDRAMKYFGALNFLTSMSLDKS